MRILHIVQRYWPASGGAETHMGELSARLAAEGHQVTVITTDALDFELFWDPHRRRIPERQEEHQGVRILRFPVRHLPGGPLTYAALRRLLWILSAARPTPISLLHSIARFTPWVPELWRWLEVTDEPFDLVGGMTICFEPLIEAGRRFARKRGIPFVVYPLTHLGAGAQPGADSLGRFYTMRHQVHTVLQSDALVAQTPTEASFYQQRGLSAERIRIVGCGVHPEALQRGDGGRFRARYGVRGPLVFCLSSMSQDKGTFQTVEALRLLWRRGYEATLALAGTMLAPFARYLQRLSAEERRHILLLGRISEEEKLDLLAAGDVFCMPSRSDSFGITYLEAWLFGKPVIGARTWGVTDVISDGSDGLIVPFGDAEALAQAVVYLLDHPAEAAAMGQRGRAKVLGQHTWEAKHRAVHELYRALLERGTATL